MELWYNIANHLGTIGSEVYMRNKKRVKYPVFEHKPTIGEAIRRPIMAYGALGLTGVYVTRPEVSQPDWEGEWERVQRMRREKHPLIRGGNYVDTTKSFHINLCSTNKPGRYSTGRSNAGKQNNSRR